MKKCKTCGEVLPLDAFGLHSAAADGRRPRCRHCRSASRRALTASRPKVGPGKGLTLKPFACKRCGAGIALPRPIHREVCVPCAPAHQRETKLRSWNRLVVRRPQVAARERRRSRDKQRQLRLDAIEAYGGACKCCGETIYEFLSVDHEDGRGSEHRRSIGRATIYRWLRQNGYPRGFRLLCHNCNASLGHYGVCPHRPEDRLQWDATARAWRK